MLEKLRAIASKLFSSLEKEATVLKELDAEVRAAVARLDEASPGLKQILSKAHGYAVFPSVGKAAAVLGGAFGKGEVVERGRLIGYSAVAQLTIGLQLGGDTFVEIVAFQNKQALDRFKQGKTAFAANASAVLIKAGASATADYAKGVAVFVHSEGGMMLEAAIGGQHFFYRPGFMGRTRAAPTAPRPKRSRATKKAAKPARSASQTKRPPAKARAARTAKVARRPAARPRRKPAASRK
jgi:lipid-binding SYLF domain-containing protein